MLSTPDVASMLEAAGLELTVLLGEAEREIESAGREFGGLAQETDRVLELAASVIACVEDPSVQGTLPRVQSLGGEAKKFIQERLAATSGLMQMAHDEARLLERLAQLTRGQSAVSREIQSLSVLTNIEVARLSQFGSGFQYLARQLDDFSQSVAKGTKELAGHAEERKRAIEATQRLLAVEVPRMSEELTRIDADLGRALLAVDTGMTRLSEAPEQFRGCVEEMARKIAGVVTAIQGHDITRQQVEHVRDALKQVAAMSAESEEGADGRVRGQIATGLGIQIYQLRSTRETMSGWVEQIRMCVEAILAVGSAELIGLGPMVLEQERGLTQELARIEALEQQCQLDSADVQGAQAGLSRLMQLVCEHVSRSRRVRDRLKLLTFNSIIESSHLGTKADAILEISQNIKRIGTAWAEMTDRSAEAMEEILALVERGKTESLAYAEGSNGSLAMAQAETGMALEGLRSAAGFAAQRASGIEASIAGIKAKVQGLGSIAGRLSGCSSSMDSVLNEIEAVKREFDMEGAPSVCGQAEAEMLFGGSYTTEMERVVLLAALVGGPLPAMQQSFAGNDVELF